MNFLKSVNILKALQYVNNVCIHWLLFLFCYTYVLIHTKYLIVYILKKRVFNFCYLLDNRSLYLLETSSSIKLLNSSFHFCYFSYYKKKTIARSLSMNHNSWDYSYNWCMVNLLNQQSFYAIVNRCLHFLLL